MTIEVGHCERVVSEGKPDVFYGEVSMAGLVAEFYLIPAVNRRDPVKSPNFVVKVRQRGDWIEMGKAWTKRFRDGSGEFFSIQFDGPHMPNAINVAAFPDDDQPKDTPKGRPAQYTVRWGRPRGGRAAAPAGVAADAAPLSDEIPY